MARRLPNREQNVSFTFDRGVGELLVITQDEIPVLRLPFGKAAESSALISKILARDSELLHFGLKCGAFKPQAGRGAPSPRYYASGVSQNPENMFPLGS